MRLRLVISGVDYVEDRDSTTIVDGCCDEIALKDLVHFVERALLYIDKSCSDIMGHKVSHDTGHLIA